MTDPIDDPMRIRHADAGLLARELVAQRHDTLRRFEAIPAVPGDRRDSGFFASRPVWKGGSFATAPRMKHPRYRNFFSAGRNDMFAGSRRCGV
jgi:formylglycine-generating enzyme required for sulfatase activity